MVGGYFGGLGYTCIVEIIVLLLHISSDELQNIHRCNYREALSAMMIIHRNLRASSQLDLKQSAGMQLYNG